MEIKNKTFQVGEKYRGDTNGKILTITKVVDGFTSFNKPVIWISYADSTGKTWTHDLETMQHILLTKIAE